MDLRTPIGLLFTIAGVMLVGFGVSHTTEQFRPVGVNIDLVWGGVMLAFGVIMLLLAYAAGRSKQSRTAVERQPVGHPMPRR
jgi:steroid 5-alpha reductase family enzyme